MVTEELILLISLLTSKKKNMKNKFKSLLLLSLTSLLTVSCVSDDDYVIPTVYDYAFNETFSDVPVGSGSTEVAIDKEGWVNVNFLSTRLWHGREYSNDKYAEFSSYYSNSGTSDEVWLITPAIDLTSSNGEILSFTTKYRYSNGDVLRAYISTDFDGNEANINTSNWEELNIILPSEDDVKTKSGDINLSSYNSTNVRIAFVYEGSKATGLTTTCQLDDIKILKN